MANFGDAAIDNKYELLKLVASGGTSTVYLASDRNLNKQWAVKKIKKCSSPEMQKALMAEAEIMKKLDHPMLPRITDIINAEDCFYIVMDYVEGENLKKILRAEGAIDQDTVVDWSLKLADLLSYLHSKGIIYRDMKPANIMLTPSGSIKLIDFGIAREYKEGGAEDTVALGTEGYAAPEQYEGHGQTDARTDVFGLGVTMFQLLTNVNPQVHKGSAFRIRDCNRNLSSGLEKVILKATNRDPGKRFNTAKEMRSAILNYKRYDEKYTIALKLKINKFIRLLVCGLALIAISAGLFVFDRSQTDKKYESLLNGNPSPSDITKAVELKPDDPVAYNRLIESYGSISSNEAGDYSSVFSENSDALSDKDKVKVEMHAGETILTNYSEDSERGKLLAAYPYFKEVKASKMTNFSKYKAALCYCNMVDFYKQFVLTDDAVIVKEADKNDYEALLSQMNKTIGILDEYKGAEGKHLKLTTYELMLGLISEQMSNMQEQGVNRAKVTDLVDKIETKALNIHPKVKISIEKRQNVLDEADQVSAGITVTYDSAALLKGVKK